MKTMKPKNFAMITEDKVTEIFCIADDFCKVFDAQMAKYTFKAERKHKYHRESRMSKAEIMVIMILCHSSGYRCLKQKSALCSFGIHHSSTRCGLRLFSFNIFPTVVWLILSM